jgi:hypothetical protein
VIVEAYFTALSCACFRPAMSIFFILGQVAAGEAALAALGKGGNASAIATAPRPIAAEPTYIQVYRP